MWVIIGSILLASPKEITHEWENQVLGIRYEVTDLAGAVEEMTIGITEPYFEKDLLEKLTKVTATGEYIEYWKNGQIKVCLPYKDGKANGHLHGWYEDGNDAFKGFFKEGVKQGIHISFYPPGVKGYPTDARVLTYNEKGKLDGEQSTSYPSGELKAHICYENGNAQGSFWCEDVNGNESKGYYAKGKLMKDPRPEHKKNKPMIRLDDRYVDEAIRDCAQEVERDFGLKVNGSGASMPFDVERISIKFVAYKKGTVEEARELIVKITEKFIDAINRHEKLKIYLREYPFTSKRVDVSLSFCKKTGGHYADGSVAYAFLGKKNKIFYDSENPQTKNLDDLFEESYEDAEKIVRGQK